MKVITMGMNNIYCHQGKSQREMLNFLKEKCDALAVQQPDLIVFPEMAMTMAGGGTDTPEEWNAFYEVAVGEMCEVARQINSCIVFNLYEPHGTIQDKRFNTTLFINRDGSIGGKYHKLHTVYEESTLKNQVPGREVVVIDTEFGKVGFATCFDINWPEMWTELQRQGAKMVIWCSEFDGGRLLNAVAALHRYWVISAVDDIRGRIIDPMGDSVEESGCFFNTAIADIELDLEIFHMDRHREKIVEVMNRLGSKVRVHIYSDEGFFSISSKSPEWPVSRIKEEFGLMNLRDYLAEAEELQKEWREYYG